MKKKRKKNVKKKMFLLCLLGFLIFIFITCGFILINNLSKDNNNKNKNKEFNIVGSWYYKKDKSIFKYEFNEDGTFTLKDDSDDIEVAGTYRFYDFDMNLFLYYNNEYKDDDTPTYYEYSIVSHDSNNFIIYSQQSKDYTKLYNKNHNVKEYTEKCTTKDSKGFCITDGYLSIYTGRASKVTIPSNVHTIGSNAFAGDYDRGVNLETVIIPGNVKIIEGAAFGFSTVDKVYIEEGLERINTHAFMEACVSEIHFPKSLRIVKYPMFGAEEYCRGNIDIYVYKDSYMDEYFKDFEPNDYSEFKIHYEKQ